MKMFCLDLVVRSIEHINERYVLIRLTDDKHPLPKMLPGQFVEVRVDNSPTTFLRRPISINFVDYATNELWLLVATIGDGTRRLAKLHPNETLNCVFPLGNGFTIPSPTEECLLIGGGVGVAPLLYLAKEIKEMGGTPTMLLGARKKNDLVELDYFKKYGNVLITTEDGSEGEKGFVTNHSILTKKQFDKIYTCGPKPMMMAVARYASKAHIECEVSLENNMACGLGACLCCVEKTIEGNLCVCKEGPVFNINQLLWQV
ncbi:MAG: dihydroorotate dehydrogenase electron transfer subunit [Prevotella sp.]|nr:dihydroorotate dehydrogenase electron transfer subunit [Prevotella sp.]MBQ4029259.1 dihydroorotate dehydrogenase electron transfer subunit [Prevotella sp.]MBQ5577377.1 dihydroorotate dehydrogenase electron transfer subunit [Prevotella sp.]